MYSRLSKNNNVVEIIIRIKEPDFKPLTTPLRLVLLERMFLETLRIQLIYQNNLLLFCLMSVSTSKKLLLFASVKSLKMVKNAFYSS